ncbi:hypothetical protein PhCBS80983_g06303 [Powellomyces hirtus]|uniref:Uncharacterized protein n=1 Tax=Powellomyces hirtus TaxID=109895 RepID=A0A507DPG1_9FUNG|nr:hypothetical protein PhCBS80983_g06303 [Powellomyces hirtus]
MLSNIARRPSCAFFYRRTVSISYARLASSSTVTSRKDDLQPPPEGWLSSKVSNLQQSAVKSALKSSLGAPVPTSPEWTRAVTAGEHLVEHAAAKTTTGVGKGGVINPRELLGSDLTVLTDTIRRLLGSGHPVLTTISNYYFHAGGKHVRPLIVLLMSQATSIAPKSTTSGQAETVDVDAVVSAATSRVDFTSTDGDSRPVNENILATQRRLAEITEMIHTASLLHDDVIDLASTRRSQPSANAEFGNKMAVLAGDFLLARASVALARLQNLQVVELLATVISDLVEGEFMQLRNSALSSSQQQEKSWLQHVRGIVPLTSTATASADLTDNLNTKFEYYMEKTYLKTASLIAKSARAAAVLGNATPDVADAAYAYGKNLGLAFQLVDDLLDFTTSADKFGKPVNADLTLGLATAPVLYAAQEHPDLLPLIERNFNAQGDVEKARTSVLNSDGLPRTRLLAAQYCKHAVDALSALPPSPARTALIDLTEAVLTRTK